MLTVTNRYKIQNIFEGEIILRTFGILQTNRIWKSGITALGDFCQIIFLYLLYYEITQCLHIAISSLSRLIFIVKILTIDLQNKKLAKNNIN